MNRGFSNYLDVLRFGAAFVVLISHFAYPRFTEGRYLWVRELNLGSDAVVLFFVLSGLVIAFVAQTKDHAGRQFAFNRATRLLSVALPALLLGYLLDRMGMALFPDFYDSPFYAPLPLAEQLARGLSFTNEWGGLEARLGTNGPYWSLSYEVAYYALFAVAWYLTGALRAVLLVLGVWLVGLNILLLMPAWLMGVWVWRCLDRGLLPQQRLIPLLVWGLPLVYAGALVLGLPEALRGVTAMALPAEVVDGLRFSDEFLWNNLLAVCVALHLLGVAALTRRRAARPSGRLIPWLAGGSFSLYLFHYPLLQFLGPALPDSGVTVVDDALLLGLVALTCYAFAGVFERTLRDQRAWLAQRSAQTKKAPSH
ncbi:acyltransferase family protein [Sulfitobacter sp. JB4-11]|uniref:acyltransferase family protein n=1 Tax=Sulfitobacter rhodophyticola TaxID=3238304 RepID=UPI003518C447